jgi:hypothetical protein
MKTLDKLRAVGRVLPRAKRNRADALRYLVRRPTLAWAISTYEMALLMSSRADNRLKALAQIKTSALVGCPF